MTLSRSNPRAKPRWLLLLALVAGLTIAFGASTLAVHDIGEFELDKNASNNTNVTPVGYLASNVNATATSINVCETGTAPATNDTILIRAERMTVQANSAGSFGGNCDGTKRTYTVERGVDDTTAAAQSGGANNIGARISLIDDEVVKAGPDWDQILAAVEADPDTKCESLGLVECTYLHDGIGPTIYTQGSTKDHLPLSGWRHTNGASPDKGEILSAYAAKAITEGGDQILYFGMDRYAVDGSTDIGFWFFQDEVVALGDGTFSGEHIEGDILILGTFTQGGATSNIRVFQWVDAGGNEQTNIDSVDDFGDCFLPNGNAATGGDDGCATVNNTTIEAPWGDNYIFKGSSTGGWIPAGGFFEGGINLTANNLDGCFSSFLAETRASPEITAILKDFALGSFEACDTELTTTPADGSGAPLPKGGEEEDGLPYTTIGTGDAGVDVTDSAILDVKGTDTWEGTLEFFLCGPIDEGETCDEDGVPIGDPIDVDQDTTQPIVSDSANLTEVGYYCWRGEFTSATDGVPDAEDASLGECFEVLPVQPDLSTTAVSCEEVENGETSIVCTELEGPVLFGEDLFDEATLEGTAHQPGTDGDGDDNGDYTSINATMDTAANGTITFRLYGPLPDPADEDFEDACTTLADGFADAYPNGIEVTVDGDGDYNTFGSGFAPSLPGTYAWKAVYSGDDPNTLGASHNEDCDDPNEEVTVLQLQPSIATAQSFVPNDSATITVGAGAGDLDGYVVFELFVNDTSCEGDAAYTSGQIAVEDDDDGIKTELSKTVSSDNETAYDKDDVVSGAITFSWVVTFVSNNDAHLGITSPCGNETSSLTIDDGVAYPTPAPDPEP